MLQTRLSAEGVRFRRSFPSRQKHCSFSTFVTALAFVPLFATGCGGGGTSDNTFTYPLSTETRQAQMGDAYYYRGTAIFQDDDGSRTPLRAESIVMVYSGEWEGVNTLVDATSLTFRSSGVETLTLDAEDHYINEPGGRRYLGYHDFDGVSRTIASRSYSNEVEYQAGSTQTIHTTYTDGTSDSRQFTVERSETIQVPAGHFAVWRCVREATTDSSSVRTVTWVAPRIGTIKRQVTEHTNGSKGSLNYTLELTRFSLPTDTLESASPARANRAESG